MKIDENNIYWAEFDTNGSIKMVSKTGGQVTSIASNVNQPVSITSDFSCIYWIERNGGTNGSFKKANKITSSVENFRKELIVNYFLSQNYPNPFNPMTKIKFDIPQSGNVTLKIFDMLGKEVATLVNENLQPGSYETSFDGTILTSGVYFYRLQTGEYKETKRMIIMK